MDDIRKNPAAPTFENTIEALERVDGILAPVLKAYYNFIHCNTSDDLMELTDWVTSKLTPHNLSITQDPVLFERVKTIYDARKDLKLSTEKRTLLKNTYDAFISSGVNLPADKQKRFQEISEELSNLGQKFEQNNIKHDEANPIILDDVTLLDDVPEDAKESYANAATERGHDGKWLISDETSGPIMTYATNRDIRELVADAGRNLSAHGEYDNHAVIQKMITLRRELANLMGYETYAHMALDGNMAQTPKTVMDFLNKNLAAYRPRAEEHLEKIKKLALDMDGITDFRASDYSYYNNINMQRAFNIDNQEVRQYFSLDNVLKGVMSHSEKLFGIKFTPADGKYPVYHDDVNVYDVHDKKSGKLIGIFYGDYFARSGTKQGGAWMNSLRQAGIDRDGKQQIPLIINCCNFMKPTQGKPALLSLGEVITVFHEMGHGLHGLLGKGRYPSLTGTNVARDFVELPSQIQENWAMEKDVLKTYAFHHETGAVIPDELIEKIIAKSNYAAGYNGLAQTYFALLDMEWQTIDPATVTSAEDVEDSVIARAWLTPRTGTGLMSTSFGHIFPGGYAAGYYGYKWAEVLDADAFGAFKQSGDLYNPDLADGLRRHIYEKGGSRQASNLFRAFMGRNPKPDAMLTREGLAAPVNDNDNDNLNDNENAPAAPRKKAGPAPHP